MTQTEPVRIVICEDSRTYSRALALFLERDEDLRVVGVCASAEELLSELPRLHADLVTMDLELPGLDGVSTIRRIVRARPQRIVVVSAHVGRGSERAAEALAAGALDAIHKGEMRLDEADGFAAVAVRRRVKRLARTRVRLGRPDGASPRRGGTASVHGHTARAIGIAASTGGPAALGGVLSALPADFPLPVLVVQHMAPGFTEGLARWLDGAVSPPVRVADVGQGATAGVWLAPDHAHLTLDAPFSIALDSTTVVGRHRPSGDVLLESLAQAIGVDAVAVVLTGMGRDGARGLAAVRAVGGLTIAQDAESAVVDGMPAAARERGAELALPPAEIGSVLSSLARAGVA